MKVVNDFENVLLKRKELRVVISNDKNPGVEVVRKKVAEKFGADESLVVVKKIKSRFGNSEFDVEVFVYKDNASKEKIEPKKKEKKVVA